MSASLGMKVGVLGAAMACLLAGYSQAQQSSNQSTDRSRDQFSNRQGTSRSSQSRAQQSGQSATQSGRIRTQQQQSPASQGTPYTANYGSRESQAGGQNPQVDHYLANCLMGKNQAEIEINQLAQQHAESREVKEFAEQMITDHQQLGKELQQLASMQPGEERSSGLQSPSESRQFDTQRQGSDATRLPGSSGSSQPNSPAGTTSPTATQQDLSRDLTVGNAADRTSSGVGSSGSNDAINTLMQIDKQITQQHTQAVREELQAKSGKEFDECYLGGQVAAHMEMLAALQVIEQSTQGQLQKVAQDAQPTVQQHLDHAKQLLDEQKGGSSHSRGQAERQNPSRTQR